MFCRNKGDKACDVTWRPLHRHDEGEWNYGKPDQRKTRSSTDPPDYPSEWFHMLVSLLSLFGDGLEGSFAVLPLEEAAVSALEAAATTARLICSSMRGSGLGCTGGACSVSGWTVISCWSLWLCRRRSWTRSSKMASCSSWIAWFRWVFLF